MRIWISFYSEFCQFTPNYALSSQIKVKGLQTIKTSLSESETNAQ